MFTVKHDLDGLELFFRTLPREAQDKVGDFWRTCANYMQRETRRGFRNQTDPDGIPWAAHSDITTMIRRKGRKGSKRAAKILQDTGRLMQSIASWQVGSTSLAIFCKVPYAWYHQRAGGTSFQVTQAQAWAISFKAYGFQPNLWTGRHTKQKTEKSNKIRKLAYGIMGKTLFIPRRMFLGFSKQDEVKLQQIWELWFKRILVLAGGK